MVHEWKKGDRGARQFRIWVQGRLDASFSEGLAGIDQQDVPTGTMLHGDLLDQSHLHSMLDLLRDLGIEVLRFEADPPHPPSEAYPQLQKRPTSEPLPPTAGDSSMAHNQRRKEYT